jgi:hypothetical protein
MEFERGVTMAQAGQDTAGGSHEELAAENARLRRLVGELLLKNQRLRESATMEAAGFEPAK